MPRKNFCGLSPDVRGNYRRRNFGTPPIPVLYLGTDHDIACRRSIQLDQVWQTVRQEWGEWDENTIAIAKAVGLGKPSVELNYPHKMDPANPEQIAEQFQMWLTTMRTMFPMIRITLTPRHQRMAKVVDEAWQLTHDMHQAQMQAATLQMKRVAMIRGGANLSTALDAYHEWLPTEYRDHDGRITGHGAQQQKRVGTIKEHLQDVPLANLDTNAINAWLKYWEKRPITKRGEPFAVDTAKGLVKTIRHFLKWLNRSSFGWKKPHDYEATPIRIKRTKADALKQHRKPRYSLAELVTLWEYALPKERLLILLALNCGFGMSEVANLSPVELILDTEKPKIDGFRAKTVTPVKWRLWPETVEALRWQLARSTNPEFVFAKESGLPLTTPTKGNNPCRDIPNLWVGLTERIHKDHPKFPLRTFNRLRKTSSHWIRGKYGAEIADLFLGHSSHETVDAYAGKPLGILRKATEELRRKLASMFAVVADPFPVECNGHPSLSLRTRKRIAELRRQGHTVKKVAEMLSVSPYSVLRYQEKALQTV